MPLSDHYSLLQLRAQARRELLDPTGRWWTNDELDQYTNDWQQVIQSQYEFVRSTATLTFTDTTTYFLMTSIATNVMRMDEVYFCAGGTDTSTGRLSPRTMSDLDTIQRNWRGTAAAAGINPVIVYQQDANSVSFWPPPAGTGTVYFEYPVLTTLSTGSDLMTIPAWTRYTAIPYILYRSFGRFGPNQDLGKASRYRKLWDQQYQGIRKFYDAYFPDKAEMLRPGRKWAGQVLRTKPAWPVWR